MRSRLFSRSWLPRLLALLVLAAGPVAAQSPGGSSPLRLARLFQDGVVLQRGARIPVWGWAAPGSTVAVTLGGRTARGVADGTGKWSVHLPALGAGGPHTLAAEGSGTRVTVRDVLVGDVWVASGQSNMEWPLANTTGGPAAVAAASDPMLREFAVPHGWSETPEPDLAGGSWARADPQHAGRFSAVAYFFARDLRATQRVPIGIIHTSWGGANLETWMSREAHGFGDSAWTAVVQKERGLQGAILDSLRARLGTLPTRDEGLVDGRAVWADPALDDAGWATIAVPSTWERAGYFGLDGTAWYRTTFTLTDAEAREGARLSLGISNDGETAWVNGTEVGRGGGYARPRAHTVPASALRAGTNVLAVRLVNGGGDGGLYGRPDQLYVETGSGRRPLAGPWKFRVGSVVTQPDGQRINKIPAYLYNRMIHPLLPYPVRGVIWYQGESNANSEAQAAAYRPLFADLVRSWRREWRGSDRELPFLWVQLPNYGAIDSVPPARSTWATLRESQTAALALPGTGQVVAIDLGDPRDIHPRNKEPVGQRLARVARRVAYGEALVASGPTYRRHAVRDGRVVIDFDEVGSGLVSPEPGAVVHEFAVAGADRRFVAAEARIEGNRVVVWSPRVPDPVAVRYAWSNSPRDANLYNREGLPARPFRTDRW